MVSLFARWMITDIFGDKPISVSNRISARELQVFIKSVFKTRIKHFTIDSDSIKYHDWNHIVAEGKVGKIFSGQTSNEIKKCMVEVEHIPSAIYPAGEIAVSFIDLETGEIRQRRWHI